MDAAAIMSTISSAISPNTTSIQTGASNPKISGFGQLLNQNMAAANGNDETELPNSQGAGQINQMLAQVLEMLVAGDQTAQANGQDSSQVAVADSGETKKVEEASGDTNEAKGKNKLVLTDDLQAMLINLLQALGLTTPAATTGDETEASTGQQPNNILSLLLDQSDQKGNGMNSNSLKGKLASALQNVLKSAANLEELAAGIEGIINELNKDGAQNSAIGSAAKNLGGFLKELKDIIGSQGKEKEVAANLTQQPVDSNSKRDEKVDLAASTKENQGNPGTKEVKSQADKSEKVEMENNNFILAENKVGTAGQPAAKTESVLTTNRLTDSVFSQIVKKAEVALKNGQSEMKIQLEPEFLGKVNMQIKIEEGVVTAKFAAESQQVKQLIEANLNTLRQNLADQGLKVDQLLVTVGQQKDFNNFHARQGNQVFHRSKHGQGGQDEAEDIMIAPNLQDAARTYGYSDNAFDYVV